MATSSAAVDGVSVQKKAIERALRNARKIMPGAVIRYSTDGHPKVSVQPLTSAATDEGGGSKEPILEDVPVLFPGSNLFRVSFALSPGDHVLLCFCDRSIDDWASMLDRPDALVPLPGESGDPRYHSMSDAVAIPIAVYANPTAIGLLETLIELIGVLQSMTIKVDGVTAGPTILFSSVNPVDVLLLTAIRAKLQAVV